MDVKRDSHAGRKLRTALLQLGALHPHGFTSEQLAQQAKVKPETARDFLKPLEYTVIVGTSNVPGRPGRRPNCFCLTPEGKTLLQNELIQYRHSLEDPYLSLRKVDVVSDEDGLFGGLVRLETRIKDIIFVREQPDQALELLGELPDLGKMSDVATVELGECQIRLEELKLLSADLAVVYAKRLGGAEALLHAVKEKKQNSPWSQAPSKVHDASLEPVRDPMDMIVRKFGRWAGPSAGIFDPGLILFNGVSTTNVMSAKILKRAHGLHIGAATFDLVNMTDSDRMELFALIGHLRRSTPVVGYDLFLVLDGHSHSEMAVKLADEFTQLAIDKLPRGKAYLPSWQGISWDTSSLEKNYFVRMENAFRASRSLDSTNALVYASALAHRFGAKKYLRKTSVLKSSAKDRYFSDIGSLSGEVVCFDLDYNVAIKNAVEKARVNYQSANDSDI